MIVLSIAHPVTRSEFVAAIVNSTGYSHSYVGQHVQGYAGTWFAIHPKFKARATRKIGTVAAMSDKRLHGHSTRPDWAAETARVDALMPPLLTF